MSIKRNADISGLHCTWVPIMRYTFDFNFINDSKSHMYYVFQKITVLGKLNFKYNVIYIWWTNIGFKKEKANILT